MLRHPLILAFFLSILTIHPVDGQRGVTPTRAFPYRKDLADEMDKFVLFWEADDRDITFEIHGRTLGWVALGISREGGMIDTDIALGWVNDAGKAINPGKDTRARPYNLAHVTWFQDRYSIKNDLPTLDAEQNLVLLSAQKTGTHTVLTFKRPIRACDSNDISVQDMFMRLVWALGTETPPDGGDPEKHQYNNRGSKSVLLMSSPSTQHYRLPSDATVITVTAQNVEVREAVESLYYVQMPIPDVNKKRHLIMWSPPIQPGNEDIVYHILCYLCYKTSEESPPAWQGYSDERPRKLSCSNILMAWSVGGGDVWLPDEAGIVIGGPDTKENKLEHLRMEIFYHNPKKLRGRIDSTSVQLWVTETLRSNDAGVILVGATESSSNFLIPPKSPHFIVDGYCPSECLQQGFLGRDVKIPMVMLHSHLTGTTVVVRHVRNGIELPYIAKEHYVDMEFQDFRRVRDPPTIRNTDDIIVECSFDTKHKTGFSSGGFSVENEYCLAIMLYYPRGSLSWCASQPTDAQMLKFLKLEVQSGKVTTEGKYKGMTAIQVLNEQNWDAPGKRQRVESSIGEGQMRLSCYREHRNGTRLPAHGQYRTLALPSKPYTEPPAPECFRQTSPASTVNVTVLPVVTLILLAFLWI